MATINVTFQLIYIYIYIYIDLVKIMLYSGKEKNGHYSSQTMTSSFSFATLARTSASLLHDRDILTKEMKCKFLISSRI